MARFFQFQNKTEAPPTADPITQNRWFQAWSEPVRQKINPVLAVALITSGLFAPPTAPITAGTGTVVPTTTSVNVQFPQQFQYQATQGLILNPNIQITHTYESRWHYPWSEPVRQKPGLAAHLQQHQPTFILNPNTQITQNFESRWHFAWSDPVRVKTGIGTHLQDIGAPDVVKTSETITADKWIYQWSEPTRRIGLGSYLQDTGAPDVSLPPSILSSQWYAPWPEPVRVKQGLLTASQDIAADFPQQSAPTAVATSALSSPVFFKGRVIYQSVSKPVFIAGDITNVGQWFNPWSEPTRIKITVHQQQSLAWSNFTPAIVVIDTKWIYPWSEPVRTRQLPVSEQQALAWSNFTPAAVTVPNQWLTEWSVPPSQKVVTSEATFNFMAVDNALLNYWYQPWPDFTYRKPSTFTAQQQAWFGPSRLPTAEVITEDKWHFAWSEPVRTRTISVANASSGQIQTLQPPTILSSQWFNPLSEPVRIRQLPVSEQQSFAWSNFTPVVVTAVTPNALSSPVFFKGRMIYQAYAKPPFPPAAEVITEDKWHQAWSEPVRTRRIPVADIAPSQIQTIQPPTILASQWIYGWSEPVRLKIGLSANLQQSLAWSNFTPLPPPTAITTSALSSPVFFKGRVIYQSLTQPYKPPTAEVITADKWAYQWSEPVRTKQFPTSEQQAFTAPSKVIPTPFVNTLSSPVTFTRWMIYPSETTYSKFEVVTVDKWIYGWSEPVRFRKFPTSEQQSFAAPSKVIPTPFVTVTSSPVIFPSWFIYPESTPEVSPQPNFVRTINWFNPFSEPVWLKKGLRAWLQSVFTVGTTPIANPVTVTLNATETNNDTALFAIAVYNRSVSANVSIKEIPIADTAYVSLEET